MREKKFRRLPSFYGHLSDHMPEFTERSKFNSNGQAQRRTFTKEERQRFVNFEKMMLAIKDIDETDSN